MVPWVITYQFFNQVDKRMQIFLDSKMKGVLVFQIDGNCRAKLGFQHPTISSTKALPFNVLPTSSIVRSLPTCPVPLLSEKPPSQPHKTVAKVYPILSTKAFELQFQILQHSARLLSTCRCTCSTDNLTLPPKAFGLSRPVYVCSAPHLI